MHNHRISSEPNHDAGKLDESKVTASELVIASSNTPKLFEFLEETLH